MKSILVTGSAGFIGFHLSKSLLNKGHKVVGVDNLNNYYDISLKQSRNKILLESDSYKFKQINLSDLSSLKKFAAENKISVIVNLAAQAGVQYSITNPHEYIESNILGFLNILEISKDLEVEHLVYASSSSVYGMNKVIPFSEEHNVDHPISLYAASKKSNELMAHVYSYMHNLPTTGLRFFTVYGPWGRPDMALFKFAKAAHLGRTIKVNNYGNHARDFTYIDDIISGIEKVMTSPPEKLSNATISPSSSSTPWRILNIGRGQQIQLMDFIAIIEKYYGIEIKKEMLPLQMGDVPETFCDTTKLQDNYGYEPKVEVEQGVIKFLDWYNDFYDVKFPLN
tara:strand:- start:5165 stop:6181 length:1017 start_codon:yes stop_codon:yes gene_type:complete